MDSVMQYSCTHLNSNLGEKESSNDNKIYLREFWQWRKLNCNGGGIILLTQLQCGQDLWEEIKFECERSTIFSSFSPEDSLREQWVG